MLRPSIFNDNLFDDFFEFPFFDDRAERKLYGHNAKNIMKTDIKEHKDGYELEIDLPGFHKDEIQAELKDGYLNISAAKQLNQFELDVWYVDHISFATDCRIVWTTLLKTIRRDGISAEGKATTEAFNGHN